MNALSPVSNALLGYQSLEVNNLKRSNLPATLCLLQHDMCKHWLVCSSFWGAQLRKIKVVPGPCRPPATPQRVSIEDNNPEEEFADYFDRGSSLLDNPAPPSSRPTVAAKRHGTHTELQCNQVNVNTCLTCLPILLQKHAKHCQTHCGNGCV